MAIYGMPKLRTKKKVEPNSYTEWMKHWSDGMRFYHERLASVGYDMTKYHLKYKEKKDKKKNGKDT